MIDNPQLLVKKFNCDQNTGVSDVNGVLVEAIFIPFRSRASHVKALLDELYWYKGPIFLMPSNKSEVRLLQAPNRRIYSLTVQEAWFKDFFANLFTSKHNQTHVCEQSWDLPIKRNYALWYSLKNGFEKILLVDDDIRGLTSKSLTTGSQSLDKFVVSGCFVEDFPDTSVIGHLERITGEDLYPFLSGSYLFLRPSKALGFFPNIYNEDWLFMAGHILDGSICSFGSIAQLPYDPFGDDYRPKFQEFGEVIAEGLYGLIEDHLYERRYDPQTWTETILERRASLETLTQTVRNPNYVKLLNIALQVNAMIIAEDCVSYVKDWEKDMVMWRNVKGEH